MRLFKHLSYVHFVTLVTWYSYSVIWCSCMGHMAVVDLIPVFFNFLRLTVNYKLQWVFSNLVYLSHPLKTSTYPKTSTTDIKMREQLSYRSILKCIASALLKCQWITMRMLVEIKNWSTKIIKNALLYTFYLDLFGCIQLMIQINSIWELWCGIKTKIAFNLIKILKYTNASIPFVTI